MVTFEREPRRHFGDEEEEEELEAKMRLLKEEGEEGPAAADEEEDNRGEEDEHGARHHQEEEEEEEDETNPLQPPTPAPRDIVDGSGFDPGDGGGGEAGSRTAEEKKETCGQNCKKTKS